MKKEPLTLAHQSLLAPRLQALKFDLSEYTFANLYLFRDIHRYEVLYGEEVYVGGVTRDGHRFIMPTCRPGTANCCKELQSFLNDYEFLYPIPNEWLPCFSPRFFASSHNDADTDYLFTLDKMRSYPGRHLSSRRNLLKQFKELYPEHRSLALSSATASDALRLLEVWRTQASHDNPLTDYDACKEAIEKLEQLQLQGRITYAQGGEVAGFVIGEPLNERTYVFHAAKGNIEYKGIYQYLYSDFALSLENTFTYINLEQDLGSADLAHAKRAYHPDLLLPKMRIHLKK